MDKIRTNIYLTSKQKVELEKLSERTGAPVAWHVRKALDEYLQRQKER